jgi:hypothetical protein
MVIMNTHSALTINNQMVSRLRHGVMTHRMSSVGFLNAAVRGRGLPRNRVT